MQTIFRQPHIVGYTCPTLYPISDVISQLNIIESLLFFVNLLSIPYFQTTPHGWPRWGHPVSNPLPGNHRGSSTLATLGEQLRLDDANAIRWASAEPNVIFSWGLFGGLTEVGKCPLFGGISMDFKYHDDFSHCCLKWSTSPKSNGSTVSNTYAEWQLSNVIHLIHQMDTRLIDTYWTSRMRHDSSRPGRVCNYCVWVG